MPLLAAMGTVSRHDGVVRTSGCFIEARRDAIQCIIIRLN